MSKGTINRVTVALNASMRDLSALHLAVDLSAQLNVELAALFIEDSNLLRLADLPFAREIGRSSGVARPITADSIRRRLNAAAEEARSALSRRATQAQVSWSFQVIQGTVTTQSWEGSAPADLLVVGGSRQDLSRPSQSSRSIGVVFDGTPEAQRALAAARALASHRKLPLHVLVSADNPTVADQLRTELQVDAGDRPKSQPETQIFVTSDAIPRELKRHTHSIVLIPRCCAVISSEVLQELATRGECVLGIVQ